MMRIDPPEPTNAATSLTPVGASPRLASHRSTENTVMPIDPNGTSRFRPCGREPLAGERAQPDAAENTASSTRHHVLVAAAQDVPS